MNTDWSIGSIRLFTLDTLNVYNEFFSVDLDYFANSIALVVTTHNLSFSKIETVFNKKLIQIKHKVGRCCTLETTCRCSINTFAQFTRAHTVKDDLFCLYYLLEPHHPYGLAFCVHCIFVAIPLTREQTSTSDEYGMEPRSAVYGSCFGPK